MIASFDYYNRFEEPIISLRSPDDAFMGFVPNVKNLTISPEFNTVSEMSCDVYPYNNGSADVDKDTEARLLQVYEDIQVKRQLFVEGIGFFIINDVSEKKDENGEYKSLSLLSCEHELSYKKLTYFNGTYPFWNEASPEESLMGMLLSSLPRWSMGHVDSKVVERYRTFEEPDTTVYSFLMDDVEDSYECLFDFDIINRTINVYDKNSYIRKTSVFLSRKDVIGSLSIDTRSEQVYTALSLYGDGEITYRGINPLGGAAVYNFAYYKSWMSEGLQAALTAWEETVAAAETSVAALRTQLSNRNTELQTVQSNMDSIQEQITLLEKQLGVNTLSPDMITSLTAQIKQKKAELSETKKRYDEKYGEIQAINRQLGTIYDACSFSNNFTEEQLTELDAYLYEASEVDDTFAFTDDMSYEKQEEILTGLYQKAKSMLADISVPTEELSLDTNNFIFQKEFLPYTEQLSTGSIIDVEISDGVCVSYVLLKLDVNYGDKSVKLTLGNKYRTSNAEALWSSWQSNVSKSSTTLTYERSKYGKAVNSGSLDEMNRFMKSSLDLTLNQVKASDGQSIEISDSGLKGRRLNPETGEADKEQLWMTANNIVFTDDNWDTVKTAIGRLVMPDGTQGYGVNAEYLMGKWVLGNGMVISNANGSFTINEDGIQSSYYDSEIEEVKSAAQQTEEKVNNLQIGGRNLARGTSVNYSAPFTNFNGGTNKTVSLGKVYTTGLSVGDVITVHLYYQYEDIVAATGQATKVYIQGSGDVTGWAYGAFAGCPTIHPTGSGEYEFLYSITITEDRLKNSYWNVSIRHDYVQSGSVCYKMFKVEKGNKATDWTPAPEDTEEEISGLKETVTTQGTEISAIQGQISSKIWQQDITTAVDNLQVGGRNLLLNSNVLYTRTNDAQTVSSKGFSVSAEALKSLIGQTVTESFYLYSPGRRDTSLNENANLNNRFGCHLAFEWRKSSDPSGAAKVIYPGLLLAFSKNERGRVSATVTVSPPEGYDVLNNAFLSMQMYAKPADANIEWEIGYPKLEIGNKATDWTPAPEDTEGKFDVLNTKYSEINQTVDRISATVACHTTEIAAKADQSEVSEVSDKVAQLEINVDGFKSEVSASYATREDFNNLQIGGRNLILGSKKMFSDGEYQGFGYKYISEPMQDQIKIGGNYQITQFNGYGCFSFLAKKDSTQPTTIAFGFSGPGGGGTVLLNSDGNSKGSVSLTNEWKRHWFIFKLKETENAPVPDIYIHLYHMGSYSLPPGETASNSYFCAPKLESGNKPTDWTPAPEDAEGEITSLNTKYSEINQTVDGITATVGMHTTELENLETRATQTAEKFSWVVASGTSESDFTLTDRTADLVAEQINLKGLVSFSGLDKDAQNEINQAITAATAAKGQATYVQGAMMDWCMNNDITYINGGKIYTGSVTANQIATGAITADKIAVKDLSALNAKLGGWSVTSTAISQSHTAADGKTYTVNVSNYSNDNADSRVFHCSTDGTDTFAVRRNGQVNCSNIIATGGKVGGWSIASNSLSKTATYNGVDYNVLINGAPNSVDSGAIIVRSKGNGESSWQNKFYVRYSGFMKATDADITGKITATSGKIGGFYIGENCLKSTSLAASSGGTGLYIFSTPEDIDLNGDGNAIKSYMAVAYNGHWEMCLSTTGSFRYRTHTGAASLNETASLE